MTRNIQWGRDADGKVDLDRRSHCGGIALGAITRPHNQDTGFARAVACSKATDAKKMLMDVDSCLSRTSCMGSDRNEPFSTGEIAK